MHEFFDVSFMKETRLEVKSGTQRTSLRLKSEFNYIVPLCVA